MNSTFKKRYTPFVALLAVGMLAATGALRANCQEDEQQVLAQMTELEQLHATFHGSPISLEMNIKAGDTIPPDRSQPRLKRTHVKSIRMRRFLAVVRSLRRAGSAAN